MPTIGEYKRMLKNAEAAGDDEAIAYFREKIDYGTKMHGTKSRPFHMLTGEPPFADDEGSSGRPESRERRKDIGGNWLDTLYNGLTAGFGDELAGGMSGVRGLFTGEGFTPAYERTRDYVRDRVANEREQNPWSALASEIGGGLLSFPLTPIRAATGLGTAARAGATYGFGEGEGGLENRLISAITGATGGALGHAALSGAGRVARTVFPRAAPKARMPEFREKVDRLRQMGIEVTPAERIASPNARQAERMTGQYFGQGDNIARRPHQLYSELMRLSNFAAEDVATGELSQQAVERAQRRFSTDYNRVLNGQTVDLQPFTPFFQRIRAGYDSLLPNEQRASVNQIITDFENRIRRNPNMPGETYQRLRSKLSRLQHEAQRSDANRYLAPVYQSIKYTLDQAFRRGVPRNVARELDRLNRQYGGFKRLQKAVDNPDAIGTLANEARKNRRRIDPRFHDLVTAYQDVLVRGYPQSSGTAENIAANSIIPPIVPALRAAGTRYGSAPMNDLGANIPLPEHSASFIAGQQSNEDLIAELMKSMGLGQ